MLTRVIHSPEGERYCGGRLKVWICLHFSKSGLIEGFTKQYNVHKLVWFESCHDVKAAIAREKQLKGWIRSKKEELIQKMNPEWKDLSQ